jgi:FkbM family methyltransferase
MNAIEIVLQKYLNYKDGVYIEAGANDGINGSNTLKLEQSLNWTGLLIEPSKNMFDLCIKNRSSKNIFLNAALVGEENLKYVQGDFDGHLMASINGERLKRQGDVSVRSLTLNKILAKLNFNKKIDFLSLDVEGYELETLKGIDLNTYTIKFILVEVNTGFYKLSEIVSLLEKYNYTLYDNVTKFNVIDNPGWSKDHNDYFFIKNT